MPKFKITLKDPDTMADACRDAAEAELRQVEGIDDEEREALVDKRASKLSDICDQWFRWGEYLTVEVDTEAGTCVVVPSSETR